MTSVSNPDFTNAMDRIDSGETNESPFGSNLVTPTEEDLEAYTNRGIHQRFDVAKTILGYFGNKSMNGEDELGYEEPCSDVIRLQPMKQSVEEVSITVEQNHSLEDVVRPKEEDQTAYGQDPDDSKFTSLNDDTIDTIHSPISECAISSLSSTDSIRPRKGSIYNLPNTHIEVEAPQPSGFSEVTELLDVADVSNTQAEVHYLLHNDYKTESDPRALLIGAISECLVDFLFFCIRVSLFLPWCVAVGGALILSPELLEPLAFGTGYIEPLSGIRRYSHWATYGFQHITSFFTLIGALVWVFPSIGYLAIGGMLAQFCFTWHGFLFDSTIPLGENDLQTVYLLATTTWLNHDDTINIKKVNDSYYYSTRSLTSDSVNELLEG